MSDKLESYQLDKRGMQMMFFEEVICIQEHNKITERLRNYFKKIKNENHSEDYFIFRMLISIVAQ